MSPESTAQTPCIPAASYRTNDPRQDGWTPDREAGFVAHLADHGVVAEACRAVGMGISGAYALRRRPDGIAFDLGWKAAMILARERLSDMLMARAIEGDETVTIKEEGTTTRRHCNPRIGFGMLDRMSINHAGALVRMITHEFDAFLDVIANGGSPLAIHDFFAAREPSEFALSRMLSGLPLVEKAARNAPAGLPEFTIEHLKDDDWICNYPPPPGFTGAEMGWFGDASYSRELSDDERVAVLTLLDNENEAHEDSEMEFEDLAAKQDREANWNPDPAYLAAGIEERDVFFGFVPVDPRITHAAMKAAKDAAADARGPRITIM